MIHRFLACACCLLLFGGLQLRADRQLGASRQQPAGSVSDPLEEARVAVGPRAAEVRTLLLRGVVQMGRPGGIPARSLELEFLFPDSYMRVENTGATIRHVGVTGNVPLYKFEKLDPAVNAASTAGPRLLEEVRAEFARLALGLLARTQTTFKLDVRATKEGETGSFLAVGPDGFSASIDLEPASRLPRQIRYLQNASSGVWAGLASGLATAPPPPPPTKTAKEIVLRFEDRRVVDGISVPQHIMRMEAGRTLEDMRFDTILVNPPMKVETFRALAIRGETPTIKK